MKITKDILKNATGSTEARAESFLPYFNRAMPKYGINNKERILAFLSQTGHESGGLKHTSELADGSAYEGRTDLGNTHAGDGVKFKGRGILQITGRSNYAEVSKALGIDAVSRPELLAYPQYAVEASAWWWKKHGLNEIADTMDLKKPLTDPQNKEAFRKITKIINGGYNGLDDRSNRWVNGKDIVLAFVQKNPTTTVIGFVVLGLAGFTIWYYWKNRSELKLVA